MSLAHYPPPHSLQEMDRPRILPWLLRCQHACGGFGADEGHDPHLLHTLSALQILALFDALDEVDAARVGGYVASLQRADGSFVGDQWGEVDTRFTYCALLCLNLLGEAGRADVPAAVAHIARCRNFDGSFGCVPGAESHAGQVFTCVAALALGGGLEHVDADLLGWWLAERQVPAGGFNGRPEKLPDVCYSWWVLSALAILRRTHWVDSAALRSFILNCQDEEGGGISDRPEDQVDVFHTFFGIAGLSLLGDPGLVAIDPVWALPVETVGRVRARNAARALAKAEVTGDDGPPGPGAPREDETS